MSEIVFPNGFKSWYETFYILCQNVEYLRYKNSPLTERLQQESGSTVFWEITRNIADKFEEEYGKMDWDEHGLLYEEVVEKFLYFKLEKLNKEHEDKYRNKGSIEGE